MIGDETKVQASIPETVLIVPKTIHHSIGDQ